MPVPNSFANVTTSIPLSQLDANFNTPITLGNTAIQLGNTVTTLNNMTLANVTISSGNTTVTSETISGNLTFTGTGNRILGDFSNATIANRVIFQSSTVNGASDIPVIPNGTGTNARHFYYSSSDTANASLLTVGVVGNEATLRASAVGSGASPNMTFYTGGSERMRVDTSGNVGIGTASPDTKVMSSVGSSGSGVVNALRLQNVGTTIGDGARILFTAGTSTTGAGIASTGVALNSADLRFYTGGSNQNMTLDANGNLGVGDTTPEFNTGYKNISISGSTGSMVDFRVGDGNGLRIQTQAASSQIINIANIPLAFHTNDTERARITSDGVFMVGTTGLSANGTACSFSGSSRVVRIYGTTQADGAFMVDKSTNVNTTAQVFIQFSINAQATGNGQINANGANAAAFGTFSDRRLKENIVDLPPQLDNILALRPVEFDFIESEGGGHQLGFIAQEVQEVYPDLVGERADGMLTLSDMNKNDARLIKAFQELAAKVTALEAEIAALKGNA